MKQIPLTQGEFALVDDEDFEWLSRWKWYANSTVSGYYAERAVAIKNMPNIKILMHRFILGLNRNDGKYADHINRNTLDNRRCNLRVADASQNSANTKISVKNKSGHRGVHWCKSQKKWRATISVDKQRTIIGAYTTAKEAALAYDVFARKIYKEFACLNFPHIKSYNIVKRKTTSKNIGVSFIKSLNRWQAQIQVANIVHYLGRFKTEREAIFARNSFCETRERQ